MKEVKFTETLICDTLNTHYNGNARYKLANAFIFMWESDFFVQKDNGYCYEFEVKISRSDFNCDKKKVDKHRILKNGCYPTTRSIFVDGKFKDVLTGETEESRRPNKFYYVVPTGMISAYDVPVYAGLMYCNGYSLETIKEAPFLHKDKLVLDSVLCKKFYHNWLNSKYKVSEMIREIEYLKSLVKDKNLLWPDQ